MLLAKEQVQPGRVRLACTAAAAPEHALARSAGGLEAEPQRPWGTGLEHRLPQQGGLHWAFPVITSRSQAIHNSLAAGAQHDWAGLA